MDDDSIAALKGLVLGERATIGVGLALEDRVELLVGVGDDVDLVGNGGSGGRLITSDHDDLHTSSTASLHRHVDLGPGRVIEGDEADKSEAVHGEPAGLVVGHSLDGRLPVRPAFGIELGSVAATLSEVGRVELGTGEGEHTLTHETEAGVSGLSLERGDLIVILLNQLPCDSVLDKDLADSLEDLLGGALEVDSNVVFCGLRVLHARVGVTDEQVELDGGGEGDLEVVAVLSL